MSLLGQLFGKLFRIPSFEELAARNRDAGRALSREEAQRFLEANPLLTPPAAAVPSAALLRLIGGPPLSLAERQRAGELLREILTLSDYPLRPGTVEDVWYLEGVLDRLTEP
jgi:hypothetical protein